MCQARALSFRPRVKDNESIRTQEASKSSACKQTIAIAMQLYKIISKSLMRDPRVAARSSDSPILRGVSVACWSAKLIGTGPPAADTLMPSHPFETHLCQDASIRRRRKQFKNKKLKLWTRACRCSAQAAGCTEVTAFCRDKGVFSNY